MSKIHDLESLMNDPFIKNILENKEKEMPISEIQKWADRCKNEIKLSKARFDGNDISGWTDECEGWLTNTSKQENVKFSLIDVCAFRELLQDWLGAYYQDCENDYFFETPL